MLIFADREMNTVWPPGGRQKAKKNEKDVNCRDTSVDVGYTENPLVLSDSQTGPEIIAKQETGILIGSTTRHRN